MRRVECLRAPCRGAVTPVISTELQCGSGRPANCTGPVADHLNEPDWLQCVNDARDWRRLGPDNVWLKDYELEVRSLERSWVEFTGRRGARRGRAGSGGKVLIDVRPD